MVTAPATGRNPAAFNKIEGRGGSRVSAHKIKGELMMRPGLSRRARVAIALSAAAGAIIVPVAIAGAGSAWGPPKMLRLVGTAQQGVGFAPDREPRQGDRFDGGAKITGDSAGIQRTVCTVIGERGRRRPDSRGRLGARALRGRRVL
jgi:hypothetical protein